MSDERPKPARSGSIFDALTPAAGNAAPKPKSETGVMDVLSLPDAERSLVTWMMRQGEVTLDQASQHLAKTEGEAHEMLMGLKDRGYVERVGTTDPEVFRTQHMAKRGSSLSTDLWRALEDKS